MQKDKPHAASGMQRIINASRWSMQGLQSAFRHEAAFRQEVYLLAILAPLGFWLGNGPVEKALLVGSLLLVLIVELINSAIENVVDLIGGEHHPLAGCAKDQGSAAVLITIVLVLLVWGLLLI